MDHSAYMGVAEIMHIGAGGVQKHRAQGIDPFAATDHRRLLAAGKFGERAQRDLDWTGAAASQGEKFINERLA
jgi:hypothetical protein